ncbi:MAG TPA: tetratricopeptide repeat protein [Actinophytocola sp.]|uniref:ATP-binding protein n=1 Tax=Actinophytocola sp. TaxID=1872138 RepID=UPI002DDD15B6|nr:tetratricopeptide repeat protein [Actinophytocola sp.]HEV2781108.1 tetratricopeptide repeat protein [Actinophytocola sp.]
MAGQLPPNVSAFTGRVDAVAGLDDLVGTVPVGLITGTAGVGKTALAIHWAHRARDRFRDGQLYANLRGYDPDLPATPAEVLNRFLAALGVAGRDIPAEVEERASMFRALVAGRRMLLVLDNASSVEQLRLLLPGTPSCFVLVTSRDSMPELVAGYCARRLELDVLTSGEAMALLRTLVGARLDADPDATADLVRHCARLPLALRIVAELANRRSTTPLAELVLELDDRRRRLTVLRAGPTAVPAVFSWTYRQLPAQAAQLFRRLGWYPGPDIDLPATAALGRVGVHEAGELVAMLGRAHLVQVDNGRITMHDLLRDYAADLATTQDSAADRSAALSALLDHHLITAARAIDLYAPYEPASSRVGPAAFADPAAALAWLDTERANLIAVALYAADHGRPDHTAQLSRILFRYLDLSAHYDDEALLHTAALRTVDPRDAMPVLGNYGAVLWRRGRYHDALAHWQRALEQARHIGSRHHEARMLGNLCTVHVRLGNYQLALTLGRRAIALLHDVQAHYGEGIILESLGLACRKLGRHEDALGHYHQALATFRRIGARHEGDVLSNIGLTYAELGYHQEAQYHQHEALAIIRQFDQPQYEAEVRNNLGITLRLAGSPQQAIPHHRHALTIATRLGDRYEQARAHEELARAHTALADPHTAHHHHNQARALHTAMGTPPR